MSHGFPSHNGGKGQGKRGRAQAAAVELLLSQGASSCCGLQSWAPSKKNIALRCLHGELKPKPKVRNGLQAPEVCLNKIQVGATKVLFLCLICIIIK